MDRQIVYTGALPQSTDILNTNKMGQIGLGYAMRGILGVNTVVHNLACNPTQPASLQVGIGVGAIYTLDTLDAAAYSDLGLDQSQIIKQGILANPILLTITPPVTSGQSQVYLVEAILSDIDTGSSVLPYYNATNPTAPFSGPGNNGMSQYTTRSVQCTIALKAGAAAPTGSQVTPTPDAGYTGLYAITVVNGQTQITSVNIVLQPTAPFFPTLPAVPNDVQTSAWTYCVDGAGGAPVVNAMVATVYPPITSLVPGTAVLVRAGLGNTGVATLNLNGTGAQPIHRANGSNLSSGDYNAGEIIAVVWDGAAWQIINFFGFTATTTNNNTFTLTIPFAVDSGSVNAMIGLFSPALTSLPAGQFVEVQVGNTNTGDSTLVCNALAAKGIRQNGFVLQPRALVAGQIVAMVFDGTFFQIINARWPYVLFDTSSPPGTDLSMAIGDQVTITFTGALQIPLKIASVQGIYEITVALSASNVFDPSWFLFPNNVQLAASGDSFWNYVTGNAVNTQQPFVSSFTTPGAVTVGPGTIVFTDGNTGNGPSPGNTAGGFSCNPFLLNTADFRNVMGANATDFGPMIGKLTISTFTAHKAVFWAGGLPGGAFSAYSRWWDASTAWTSLGTFGVAFCSNIPPLQYGTISGALAIKRLA